jgi:hypothetical protein
VEWHLPAEKGEPPGERGFRLGQVLAPELVRTVAPEQGWKEVAWVGLRVVVLAKWTVAAQAANLFFEEAAEQQDWAQEL